MGNARLLITSDLHLTSKPKDAYRCQIFDWLIEQAKRYEIDAVCILGDLTDNKNNHDTSLVNFIVDSIDTLRKYTHVYILRGNHDGYDRENAFFRFLRILPRVEFFDSARWFPWGDENLLFLPHERDINLWRKTVIELDYKINKVDYIFLHQTFDGAEASNGMTLEGTSTSMFDNTKAFVASGDIHVPQRIGQVHYVGSPYHVHFGDTFVPRLFIVQNRKIKQELRFPTLSKHHVKISRADSLTRLSGVNPGDQIKITLMLSRSSFVDWEKIRSEIIDTCKDMRLDLHGIQVMEKKRPKLNTVKDKSKDIIRKGVYEIYDDACSKFNVSNFEKDYGRKLL